MCVIGYDMRIVGGTVGRKNDSGIPEIVATRGADMIYQAGPHAHHRDGR
jgi:hypothetical protein